MQHPSLQWIAMGLAVFGGLSAVFWVLFVESGRSDMTALRDGLFLEYQVGDDEDGRCRLTFNQQEPDMFKVVVDADGDCPVAPFSIKSSRPVETVNGRTKPIGEHVGLVTWGGSDRLWIPPDRQDPVKGVPRGFVVRRHAVWSGFDVSVVEITFGGLNRQFFFDRRTGFLVGMEERGVDHQFVAFKLSETNAQ